MRQQEYQTWLTSLTNQDLVCLQQPISDDEQSLYRFNGKWRYSLVKVLDSGRLIDPHSETVKYLKYSVTTGEILDPITNKPVENQYLVPAFDDMDFDCPDVISNVSFYPLELELAA